MRGANSSKTHKLVGLRKKRGWKSRPKEARFPVYLYFITKRMRYFRRISVCNAHTYTNVYIRANMLHTAHRSVLPGGPSSRLLYCSVGCFATA